MTRTRRLQTLLLAGPLTLALSHCASDQPETREDDALAAQQVQPLDAGTMTDDASRVATSDAMASAASDAAVSAAPFQITSSVVQEGAMIDVKYRCNAPSPPLSWTAGPAGTASYALVFRDQGNGFYHWIIYDIPPSELGLPEGVPVGATLSQPSGAKQVPNWSRRPGYGGPCAPQPDKISTYAFTLYALDVPALPGVSPTSAAAQVVRAIEEHDLASTKLTIQSKP